MTVVCVLETHKAFGSAFTSPQVGGCLLQQQSCRSPVIQQDCVMCQSMQPDTTPLRRVSWGLAGCWTEHCLELPPDWPACQQAEHISAVGTHPDPVCAWQGPGDCDRRCGAQEGGRRGCRRGGCAWPVPPALLLSRRVLAFPTKRLTDTAAASRHGLRVRACLAWFNRLIGPRSWGSGYGV